MMNISWLLQDQPNIRRLSSIPCMQHEGCRVAISVTLQRVIIPIGLGIFSFLATSLGKKGNSESNAETR